ncbi:hypothetical protein Avbf_18385 [Armadillidium vulgare]|nr:hypothetical protein Avbf_18385 [Armadillidium vulgare]
MKIFLLKALEDLCTRAFVLYNSFDKDVDLAYHEKMALEFALLGISECVSFITINIWLAF